MALREVITILGFIFVMVLLAAFVGPILPEIVDSLMATGDYNTSWMDGEDLATGLVETWFQSILVAVFGILLWAVARVIRRELTQRGL